MLRHTIGQTLRQDLQERIDDVRTELQQLDPTLTPDQVQTHFDAIYRLRDDGKWLSIVDQYGRWIYRSARMVERGAPVQLPQNLPRTGIVSQFRQSRWAVRTFALPISVNGVSYTVETGIATKKPDAMLRQFGLGLLLLTPAVVLIAALAGYLISGKALAPVALVVNEARRISDRNLESRLPVSPANDELSQLSITLNNMLARIDAGFRSVRDFTANASHELRTPLARLCTEIEIALLRPREGAEYRESLKHLHESALEMSSVIDSLLAIARSESGSEVLRLSPIDLYSLIHSVAEEWKSTAERLGVHFRIAVVGSEDNDPIHVFGDRLSLVRLLRVFLDNAFKFTPENGSVTITVEQRTTSVLLAVEDTGIGISPEHHGSIFNRFFRVHGDTSGQRSGAGLGLSLAAWIAEQHHTSVSIKSSLGLGSRFEISLARALPEHGVTLQAIQKPAHSVVTRGF
jgi:signal transduction histidine kinase